MTKVLYIKRDKILTLDKPDGSQALSDVEKANMFSDHIGKIFTSHQEMNQSSHHDDYINNFLSSPLPMSLLPAKLAEIVEIIKKLHPKKSSGHDLLTNKIIKNLTKKSILYITYIHNSLFRLSYFPLVWKYSVIIKVPKLNKPKDLISSYLSINLLPTRED